jgi:regulatory protein spx
MNEEITVYYKTGCSSCRKALAFFSEQHLPVKEVNVKAETIPSSVLLSILKQSENGFLDLLKGNIDDEHLRKFEEMTTMDFIDFITKNPENQSLLRTPIIIQGNGEKKVNIGYQAEEIRMFLPLEVKHKMLAEIYSHAI